MATPGCPVCGGEMANGPCPRCLVKLGLDGVRPSGAEAKDTIGLSVRPGSVLATLAATIGAVPHVLLRDTVAGETPSPIIQPAPDEADPGLRYRIDGEIARGGMGAILKGRDPDLGRDVAIKVLREDLRHDHDLVRRFVEEAQIGGQLQHPGIVPIYDLGTFADRRPFFCMKLVKGQTLAELLGDRANSSDDLPRFLSIFAAMAQTMAYAHTRGVIHRDLKPSNVMVGSFGEVQVMDWGLAKVLPRGGVADDAQAGKEPPAETLIATARSDSDADQSRAGSILGTPSYMPPEQAQGEIDRIDERADVFALGSILAEILTGSPAYTGRTSGEILRKAARGDTYEVLTRLQASGADPDLIALATASLAREPEDRPHDATTVSRRITGYLASVQERVQTAERERAVAEARAVEERKQRKLQLGLAATIFALATMAGFGIFYEQRQRSTRAATLARVIAEVTTLRDQARANPEDPSRWRTAVTAANQAEGLFGNDPEARGQLTALKQEVQVEAEMSERDRILIDKLADIRFSKPTGYKSEEFNPTIDAYSQAFRNAGLELSSLPATDVGAKIKARPASVAQRLVSAIDDWTAIIRDHSDSAAEVARLTEVARVADPDPWRNSLRATLALRDKDARKTALLDLSRKIRVEEMEPVSLVLLGEGLSYSGGQEEAEKLFRRGQIRYPGDVWINYTLAGVLNDLGHRIDAIRFYSIAHALRPHISSLLISRLADQNATEEATGVFRDLVRLYPDDIRKVFDVIDMIDLESHPDLTATILDEASAICRRALETAPNNPRNHMDFGFILEKEKKYEGAVAEYREAIRLDPHNVSFQQKLVETLIYHTYGHEEAILVCRSILTLAPKEIGSYTGLGDALRRKGFHEEAIRVYHQALKLSPNCGPAHAGLAVIYESQGKGDQAEAELRQAVASDPGNSTYTRDLCNNLQNNGKIDEVIAVYRKAVQVNPDDCFNFHNLAGVLEDQGKFEEAAEVYRSSIQNTVGPRWTDDYIRLGDILTKQGKIDQAIKEFREAIRIHPDVILEYEHVSRFLANNGHHDEIYVAFHEILRSHPKDPIRHRIFGSFLEDQGKLDEAESEHREALRLLPRDGNQCFEIADFFERREKLSDCDELYRNLFQDGPGQNHAYKYYSKRYGSYLERRQKFEQAEEVYREAIRREPKDAQTHTILGKFLLRRGKSGETISEYRDAIMLEPKATWLHVELGEIFESRNQLTEADAEFLESIRLEGPYDIRSHRKYGNFLVRCKKLDQAATIYREVIRRRPNDAETHDCLGYVLRQQGRFTEAVAECREAHRLKPDDAQLSFRLGYALRLKGDLAESLAMYRAGHERNLQNQIDVDRSAALVAEAERLAGLGERLPTVSRGDDHLRDNGERLSLALACYYMKRYATAAQLSKEAFEAEPELAEDRSAGHRYNAACDAVLAGLGRGKDDPLPDEAARSQFRAQALAWLQADLVAWGADYKKESAPSKAKIASKFRHWKGDRDLAGVREPEEIAKLPEGEREGWRALWNDVDALLKRVETP